MGFDLDFDITAVVNFLTHVGPAIQALVIGSLLCYLAVNRLIAYLDKKEKVKSRTEENEAKDKRAKEFRDLLTNVTLEMKATAATSVEVVKNVTDKLVELSSEVKEMNYTLTELKNRQARVISRSESLQIVEDKFYYIRNEVVGIFEQSLRKNAYKERAPYIKDRVSAAIADIINHANEALIKDYPGLAIDPSVYFPTRGAGGSGGTRYEIIDTLWSKVVSLYEMTNDIEQRVDDMRVVVTTTINDQVQSARSIIVDLYKEHRDTEEVA